MATITEVKDRSTCSCTGMSQAAFEVRTCDGGVDHEFRIREWAYQGVWQLQRLRDGATGAVDTDYVDLGEFPTQEAALAFVEALAE